jgi:hypothetical protein
MFTRHLGLKLKPDAAVEFARVIEPKSIAGETTANQKGTRQ